MPAIAPICSTNATGFASWLASKSFAAPASAGYSAAVVFEYTAMPSFSETASSAARNGGAASATSAEWNAAATGNRVAFSPASERSRAARSMCGVGPDSTVCFGALRFATTTFSFSRSMAASMSGGAANTASIAPGSPVRWPAINCPRTRESVNRSRSLRRPAAASATSSP